MMKKYLRSKKKMLLLFLVYLGIFCLIAYLYRMPWDALIYACALCLFFGAVFMAYSWFRHRQRTFVLEDVKARIEFGPEQLPPPVDNVEEEYQQIICRLYEKLSETISERDRSQSDMTDYYTLWAHQIKTPIAAMRLLLQGENGENCPSRDAMQMELLKIEQYVEMVLQYLRLDSDTSDYLIREIDVDQVIREALKKLSAMFIRKHISLHYEKTECSTVSDEKWLAFVVGQILSNALKYTPAGGDISVYMDPEEENTLVIEDTGIGIQPEDLPRVFDRGYTGYNGRTDKKSTGIGLYLCRRICRKLGHSLRIESEVEKGTRVKIGLAYKSVSFE
ncbi:MAG: sensor histidine kinase [Emergencia sp.]